MFRRKEEVQRQFREAYEAILSLGFSPTEAARLALPVVKGTPVEEAVAIALSVMPMSATEAAGGPDASTVTSAGSVSLEGGHDVDMTPPVTTTASMPTPVMPGDVSMSKPSSMSTPSPALPPAVSSSFASPSTIPDAHLAVPGLTLTEFQSIYDSCATSDSFGPVIRLLGARLRSWEQVNNSFALDAAVASEGGSGIAVDDVMKFYDTISASPSDGVRNSLMNAMDAYASDALIHYKRFTSPNTIRQFLVVCLNPGLATDDYQPIVGKVYRCLDRLAHSLQETFIGWLQRLPAALLRQCVETVQWHINRLLKTHSSVFEIEPPVVVLGFFHEANEAVFAATGHRPLSYDAFYNHKVSAEINLRDDFERWASLKVDETGRPLFSFCAHSYILDSAAKAQILQFEASRQMAMSRGSGFMAMIQPNFVLKVSRDRILEDALDQIVHVANKADLKKELVVKFMGEAGIDQGGVKKEFFQILTRRMFDPEFGMFVIEDDDRTLWFRHDSFEGGIQFELIGSLIGLAIYNGVLLDLSFPMVVYRKLVGIKPTLRDLTAWKPEVGRSLSALLEYDKDDLESVFCLNFTYTVESFGAMEARELKPGGEGINVTQDNKQEYVDLVVDFLLNKSIATQFGAFYRGFMNVADGPALKMFRAEELEQLVVGSKELDFLALETAARYEEPYGPAHPIIRQFWDIVHGFTEDEKKQLLSFCTGSHRAPIRGLGALRLIIGRQGPDSEQLPTSHTCFNHLLLPEYHSKEKLETKLRLAIAQSEGFGLM